MIIFKADIILLITFSATCFGYVSNIIHPPSSALIKLGDYDAAARPPGRFPNQNSPVNVSINLFVLSIDRIDYMKNEFTVQIYFREEWDDSRLAFKNVDEVSTSEVQHFWRPDIFFQNDKTGYVHTLAKPNAFVRIRPNGEVLLSTRLTLKLNCPMNLWRFPFDSQRCEIRMESYGYTAKDINLIWKGSTPVDIPQGLFVPGFSLQGIETTYRKEKVLSGEYSCLQAHFQLKRNRAPYVIRVYVPLFLLVIASWSAFWIPTSKQAIRISVASITSLTTVLLIMREEDLLHLPIITTLDIWVGVSAFFVFAAFFEYVLLCYLENRKNKMENKEDLESCKSGSKVKFLWIKMKSDESATDDFSKIAFSVSYLLFNLLFLCILL